MKLKKKQAIVYTAVVQYTCTAIFLTNITHVNYMLTLISIRNSGQRCVGSVKQVLGSGRRV